MFFRQNTCKKAENPYFCIVFFIVLDLRLTRLGYSGIPFFMPKSLETGKHTHHNRLKTMISVLHINFVHLGKSVHAHNVPRRQILRIFIKV